jgi:hypothetical protein
MRPSGLQVNQYLLHGGNCGLRPVGRVRPRQDHADVAFDCGPGNAEFSCNFLDS